LKNLLEY